MQVGRGGSLADLAAVGGGGGGGGGNNGGMRGRGRMRAAASLDLLARWDLALYMVINLPVRSLGPRRRSASRGRRGSQESLGSKGRRGQEGSQERRRRTEVASQESLMSSRQSPRQGRRRSSSRQEAGEERREEVKVGKQPVQRRSRGRSVSRDNLVEPAPKVEDGVRKGYSQWEEEQGDQRKAREERGRAQSREELRESRGGRRVEEGQAGKQSLAGEFIDFYLGRARK